MFDARAMDELRDIFAEVCARAQATLVEIDGDDDPVRYDRLAIGTILPRPEGQGLPRVPVSAITLSTFADIGTGPRRSSVSAWFHGWPSNQC